MLSLSVVTQCFLRMAKKQLRLVGQWLLLSLILVSVNIVSATEYQYRNNDYLVGAVSYTYARYEDTLLDIARQNNVGYNEITRANSQVNLWLPGEGSRIRIPQLFILPATPRRGITLNLAERRLYFFPEPISEDTRRLVTVPVGIGREGWQTPIGPARVINKITAPSWTPPPSIVEEYRQQGIELPNQVPPGPDNPLGEFAMLLSIPGYLLHGTNRPDGIGMRVSHGCIRLFPEDIKALFNRVALDTPVWIIDQPDKVGWRGDFLYLESHPASYSRYVINEENYRQDIQQVAMSGGFEVNWSLVEQVHRRADGVPAIIGRRLPPVRQ
ncbi:L,D-transpeptidase family protein [Amphritea balenae]|uniref:L,D-TPase catalytic domain-containing protein n=1 Tax=Amphritea balenae TaxID=452629 RepID=A0A3P1SUY4_9GAMM|nr:L,D-transpeptidase family protein [Amphritea balenae]RRD01022.1 hypothetical protein EHS89_00175 [Amphritea balenae]GGK60647.1 hypothetical protein GCM10007941_08610 [Amphritea balenae]